MTRGRESIITRRNKTRTRGVSTFFYSEILGSITQVFFLVSGIKGKKETREERKKKRDHENAVPIQNRSVPDLLVFHPTKLDPRRGHPQQSPTRFTLTSNMAKRTSEESCWVSMEPSPQRPSRTSTN